MYLRIIRSILEALMFFSFCTVLLTISWMLKRGESPPHPPQSPLPPSMFPLRCTRAPFTLEAFLVVLDPGNYCECRYYCFCSSSYQPKIFTLVSHMYFFYCTGKKKCKQAVKLTVSQIEIGFDILKAREVEATAAPQAATSPTAGPPKGVSITAVTAATLAGAASGPKTAVADALSDAKTAVTGAVSDSKKKAEDDSKRKGYRLMVKRRLLKRHGEELSAEAPARKRQLEELYRDVEGGFLSLGVKLKKEEDSRKREQEGDGVVNCTSRM